MSNSIEKQIENTQDRLLIIYSSEVIAELDKRYKRCDAQNHIGPVIDNVCRYCFRQKKYEVDDLLKEKLESRKRIHSQTSSMNLPCDAPYWFEKTRENIESQKSNDYLVGLMTIAKEMYPEKFKDSSRSE